MRAVVLRGFGDTDVLSIEHRPIPEPAAGEVRIQVAAATVNRTDVNLRTNVYGLPEPGPEGYGLGADVSGVVDAAGPSVTTSLRVGDQVIGFSEFPHLRGAQAEYVVLPTEAVTPAPRTAALIEAATLPLNGLTAWQALEALSLPAKATVVVTGAAGGLGIMLTQLARAAGHVVVAWVRSGADADYVREFGANQVVTSADQLPTASADVVLDAATLGAETVPLIKDGGTFVTFRGSDPALDRGIRRVFIMVRNDIRQLQRLVAAVDDGIIRLPAVIPRPLHEVSAAQRTFAGGQIRDRIVLVL